MSTDLDPSLREEIHKGTGWGIAVGIWLVILGMIAIAVPLAMAIAIGLLLGWLFLLGGIAQIAYAFFTQRAGAFFSKLLLGLFYLIGGVSVLFAPGVVAVTLSLVLAICIVVQSVVQIATAVQMRLEQGWGWMLFSGIIGLILAALIWAQGPVGAVWLLGVWFGLKLVFDGIGIVMASCLVRSKMKQLDREAVSESR